MPAPILLLIEDDEDDYIITRDLLREIYGSDFSLEWQSDIELARQALAQNTHHICLMDYSLGVIDGISLLRETTELGYTGPVIMLTGQDDARLDDEALSAGAVDYLVKNQLTTARLARAIRYGIARRGMEQERIERLRAESENRAKSQFLAHLSHELRTPLTAILGYTDLLINTTQGDTSRNQLHIIKRNGNHLLSLLNDILDLSKIEAGKLDIELREIELSPFISDIYHLMQVNSLDKGLAFSVTAKTNTPITINTDPTRLRQILLNLLGNAIKFTDEGSVLLELRVTDIDHEPILIFNVIDSGIGIPQSDFDKLYKPFSQSSNILTRQHSGSGLGLAISQQLANRLGGHIELQSQQGFGSQFSLYLPIGNITGMEKLHIHPHSNQQQNPSEAICKGRILLADDVTDIRYLVGHFLDSAGATVSYATNGQEALDQFIAKESSNEPFDLLLIDMQMPIMSGMQLTQELRQQGFTVPIIALTAATMKGERDACLAMGFTDHLSKPIDQQQLLHCVATHLGNTPAEKENNTIAPKKLLLIEDNKDAREATAQLLVLLGFDVTTAATGQEALDTVINFIPDIILCDLNLPDIYGVELAEQLSLLTDNTTHFIALSGETLQTSQLEASRFNQHIIKPIDIGKLQALLNR